MIIYQVIYNNQFGERVADFGYYQDQLDAEKRAMEVREKTSPESGNVYVEEVFVYDSTNENFRHRSAEEKSYGLK